MKMVLLSHRYRCDAVHPCWESRAPYPRRLLSREAITRVHEAGLKVIAWHENSELTATQWPVWSLEVGLGHPTEVHASDLDGDGDADVLSVSPVADKIVRYENDGSAAFGPEQTLTVAAHGPTSVHAADLDGDGDIDVLSTSYYDAKISW